MLFVGYFEGIEASSAVWSGGARTFAVAGWTFLGVQVTERVPDHFRALRGCVRVSTARSHGTRCSALVLGIVESKGLLRGKVAGVDSTYLRADALDSEEHRAQGALGDDYTTHSVLLCEAQGIENPTVEDARRMDRTRKGKKVSNKDWASPTDADGTDRAAWRDGCTRLGYKAEHEYVDLDTGAVVAAEVYSGEQVDTATLRPSLEAARDNIRMPPARSRLTTTRATATTMHRRLPRRRGSRVRRSRSSPTRATTRWSCSSNFGAPSIGRTSPCPTRRASGDSPTRAECSRAKRFTTIERACVATRA